MAWHLNQVLVMAWMFMGDHAEENIHAKTQRIRRRFCNRA